MEAVLFRMRKDDLELVCSVRRDVVRLTVNGERVPLPRALPTLDDIMTDWPRWLRKTGWQMFDVEER